MGLFSRFFMGADLAGTQNQFEKRVRLGKTVVQVPFHIGGGADPSSFGRIAFVAFIDFFGNVLDRQAWSLEIPILDF